MKQRLAIPLLIALLALVGVASSQAETEQVDNLRVRFDANFDPHSLPRVDPAPVQIKVSGAIATTDGSHPPPLRSLEIELNRSGRLFTKGLPVCSASLLQSTSTEEALARCGPSQVGRGSFDAVISLGSDVPASGEIIAFNSRAAGKPALLLHFFAASPARFTLVVPLAIRRKPKGDFGTMLRTRIPRLAGDLGSITEIDLAIGRRYSFAGKRRSYVSAACGAPAGFSSAFFKFARIRFRFESHRPVATTLARTCQVREPV